MIRLVCICATAALLVIVAGGAGRVSAAEIGGLEFPDPEQPVEKVRPQKPKPPRDIARNNVRSGAKESYLEARNKAFELTNIYMIAYERFVNCQLNCSRSLDAYSNIDRCMQQNGCDKLDRESSIAAKNSDIANKNLDSLSKALSR